MNPSAVLEILARALAAGDLPKNVQIALGARLASEIPRVRRLEVTLDEIAEEAAEDERMQAASRQPVVVQFPKARRLVPVFLAHEAPGGAA